MKYLKTFESYLNFDPSTVNYDVFDENIAHNLIEYFYNQVSNLKNLWTYEGKVKSEVEDRMVLRWRNPNNSAQILEQDSFTPTYQLFENGKLKPINDLPSQLTPELAQWSYSIPGRVKSHLHRENGPALISLDTKVYEWYQNGSLHNTEGPAVIKAGRPGLWFVNGERLTPEQIELIKLRKRTERESPETARRLKGFGFFDYIRRKEGS